VDLNALPGILVYLKASLTGDEPSDVLAYADQYALFPHESTANQFFTESQFESYRALGFHIVREVFGDATTVADIKEKRRKENEGGHLDGLEQVNRRIFSRLRRRWFPPPPDLEPHFLESVKGFVAVHQALRRDPSLREFTRDLYPELAKLVPQDASGNGAGGVGPGDARPAEGPASTGANDPGIPRPAGDELPPPEGEPGDGARPPEAVRVEPEAGREEPPGGEAPGPGMSVAGDRHGVELNAVSQMLQVMENAWLGLKLSQYYEHPLNRGWMTVFRRWTNSSAFSRFWPALRGQYSQEFVQFCEKELKLVLWDIVAKRVRYNPGRKERGASRGPRPSGGRTGGTSPNSARNSPSTGSRKRRRKGDCQTSRSTPWNWPRT
jgi:hypothetical protein